MTAKSFSIIGLTGVLAGCATTMPPPALRPAPVLPVTPSTGTTAALAAPISHAAGLDQVTAVILRAEDEFELGRIESERGRVLAARAHFDAAIDALLKTPEGARGDARLQSAFERLLDRIAALEVMALREADGVAEARTEPAAIDEVLGAATFDRPVPRATTAETVAADLDHSPSAVVGLEAHPRVLEYVELFQGRLREFLQGGLDRGQRYLPMIHAALQEAGLPAELAYVPLVESAFKSTALSRASARGMWQFMLPTAREYGLQQDWFIDERADPEKSTRAAARYLRALHATFDGDWALALASYNGGPGRVQRAVRQSNASDFWTLSASTRFLPRETREYVPMILAAALIGRNPELYGFTVAPSIPLAYETVEIPGALDLKIIAEWAGSSIDELRDLNPELRRTTTPGAPHALRVPIGTAGRVQATLASSEITFRTFRTHSVRSGESLSVIARRYGTTVAELMEANGLRNSRLRVRQELVIPTRFTAAMPAAGPPAAASPRAAASGPATYRVRQGDTLFGIARQFSTTVAAIKQINGLRSDVIRPGDVLRIRR